MATSSDERKGNREIDILAAQISEVFDQQEVPADWDEKCAFISIDDPDEQLSQPDAPDQESELAGSDVTGGDTQGSATRLPSTF